jgi:DNA-binding transcriptional ArsR family regulator
MYPQLESDGVGDMTSREVAEALSSARRGAQAGSRSIGPRSPVRYELVTVLLAMAGGASFDIPASLDGGSSAAGRGCADGLRGRRADLRDADDGDRGIGRAVSRRPLYRPVVRRASMTAESKPNPTISTTTRLAVMAVLAAVEEMEFSLAQDAAGVSDSVLSKQATALKKAGYLKLRKGGVGRGRGPGCR